MPVGGLCALEDLPNGVTDSEVRPVHVAGDHERSADRQMVMGDIREPEGFGLGVETTQEGQDRSA